MADIKGKTFFIDLIDTAVRDGLSGELDSDPKLADYRKPREALWYDAKYL